MPYEDSPSDCWFAQSRQSYNVTEVHFILKRSCCTDSVLIKHLLSRYSIVPQLAIIYVITGLLRPCLEKFNRFHLFIYHKTCYHHFLFTTIPTAELYTRHTMQCHHHHRIQSTLHNPLSFKKSRNKYKKH